MALWLHSKWGTTPINTKNYRAIRDRKISAFQWNQVGNPPEGLIGDSAETLIDEADPRASDWLYGSDKWNKSFPEGWVAIRVLGAGGYGIAGHWRYEAEGAHKMGYVQGEIHDIVVKQASAVTSKGLINEAFIMEMLTKTGSRHFPQIYGRIHRDVGQQDRVSVDQKRREVHRIFMEFCAGGSLAAYINDSSYHGNLTPETDLWSWFHCFAKAIVVLERGHEQDSESRFSRREPWGHEREVVHFDIKPDNALITVRDNDEHIGAKRVVISDFGISEVLPNERNGPHRDHDVILKEYEQVGTVIFRAPEQQGKLPRARRRYAACTNIFQIGCMMYCLIMQTNIFPDYDPPTWTTLTGRNKMHRTMGGQDLELETRLSRTLRGLAAECLHLDPRYRPTAVELLRRTRDGLKRINPWGATASKIYEKLKPVDTLMLDRWFGQNPSVVWPQRIPEMEEVVNLRRRQAHQVDLAKKYTPQNPPTANNQGGNPPGGPATGQNPPPAGNQGADPPPGPTTGQNPPVNNNQPRAPPAAGPSGTTQAQQPSANTEPVVHHKPWPGDKFTQPIDILDGKVPRKSKPAAAGNAPPKEPDWGKVVKGIKCPPPAKVPRPQKRPSQGPAPDPKRSRQSEPAPIRQIDMMNNWLHSVDLNRAAVPVPQPPTAEQDFLMPVRIWPGPLPNPADEPVAQMRIFAIPISATIRDLLRVMTADESSGVALAVRCRFARPGTPQELPLSKPLADLGYGPAPRVRSAHLECFRKMATPAFVPGGLARSLLLTIYIKPTPGVEDRVGQLTLKVAYQMTIMRLKKAVIDNAMRPDFRVPSQLMMHYGGDDPQARDFPDYRTIRSFFDGEGEGEDVHGKIWCSLRPQGQGGSGSGRPVPFDKVYTPPRYRNNRRFL